MFFLTENNQTIDSADLPEQGKSAGLTMRPIPSILTRVPYLCHHLK